MRSTVAPLHALVLVLALGLAIGGCNIFPSVSPSSDSGFGTIELRVVAGPVCPVEQDPPDPGCEPRPVEGARILVQPADGRDIVVGEATTDTDGRASIELPAGDYIVIGVEVEGLMGVPEPVSVAVGAGETISIDLAYDTGIR
jgi:hypothetical protein